MNSQRKLYTGVGLDREVVDFLAELAVETERPRSWLINAIVREKARSLREEREARAEEIRGRRLPTIDLESTLP